MNRFGDILNDHRAAQAASATSLRKDAAPLMPSPTVLTGNGNAGQSVWSSEDAFQDWMNDLNGSLPTGKKGDTYDSSYPHGWVQDIATNGQTCLVCWQDDQGCETETYVAGITVTDGEPAVVGGPDDWTCVEQQYVSKAFAGKCPNCGSPMVAAKNASGDSVKECLSCGKMLAKGGLIGVFQSQLDVMRATLERGTLYNPPAATPLAKAALEQTVFGKAAAAAPAKLRPGSIKSGADKGSYPITDAASLEDAIESIGRAKFPDVVKAHIIAAAKKLGLSSKIPDSWK